MSEDIFEQVKALDLPIGHFAIFGSGPMAIRGLRASGDADLLVTKALFDEYAAKPDWQALSKDCGAEVLQRGAIEMIHQWRPGEWDTDRLIAEAEMIDGLPCVRLAEVIRWKEIYDREKDRRDIELIKAYLDK